MERLEHCYNRPRCYYCQYVLLLSVSLEFFDRGIYPVTEVQGETRETEGGTPTFDRTGKRKGRKKGEKKGGKKRERESQHGMILRS